MQVFISLSQIVQNKVIGEDLHKFSTAMVVTLNFQQICINS